MKALAVNSLECYCSQKSLHSTVGVGWDGVGGVLKEGRVKTFSSQ